MKKIILLFLGFALMGGLMHAQNPMSIPNGSFEQWTEHPGYSVSVFYIPFSVYDSYTTPNNWDYPSYPVNESVSIMGMSININTSIPLVKTSSETGAVPDGNKAVKLQTFMIDDIIDPTMLSLAGDYIDSSISQQVIPSILSTGAVDLEAFIPLISNIMSDSADFISLIPSLLAMDVNDYISGGIALGDFKPGKLTGSYKYQSATSGDNGGVILLGTHYNSTTHQRDIVGGGINLALTDTGVYSYFEAEYASLGGIMPNMPNIAPDSLVVILVSSASENRQQGSFLCLDNLMLWPAPPEPEVPDTCASVLYLSIRSQSYDSEPEMVLTWQGSSQPGHWQVEYGPQGFELGTGSIVTTDETYFEIYPLENNGTLNPNTWYDFYVRSVCNDSTYGDWDSVQYCTPCASVSDITINSDNLQVTANNLIAGYSVTWTDNSDTRRWYIYYGIYSPEFPDNWGSYVEVDTNYFEFPPLRPDCTYSAEIAAHCGEYNYGIVSWVNFETQNITGIYNTQLSGNDGQLSITPNPAKGQCMVNINGNKPAEMKLYSIDGRLIQTTKTDGSPVIMRLPNQGIFLLQATASDGTKTQKIVISE